MPICNCVNCGKPYNAPIDDYWELCDVCNTQIQKEINEAERADVRRGEGYWYTDKNGNRCHTWDYEESIGELGD